MAEYDLSQIFEDVILKIGDNKFKLRERTPSLTERVSAIRAEILAMPDDAPDRDGAAKIIELVDAYLEPVDVEGETRRHAKTVLSKSYKAEEIGLDRIVAIQQFLDEKFEDRRRPTSELLIGS